MTKRANGEGLIRQRPSGLWEGQYIAADGKRASIYAKTQGDLLARLRVAQGDAAAGVKPAPQLLTVGRWLNEWLDASVRPRCRPATTASYEMVAKVYLRPAIGDVRLSRLTPDRIGAMLTALTARGDLSPTTVRYAYSVLRIALGRALKAGKVTRNVATLVDPPARATHEIRPLTGDQVRKLLVSLEGDPLEALYVAAIGTGLRQGELFALRWSDVDLDGRMLTVRRSLDRMTRTMGEPKTDRAKRTIALPRSVEGSLRDHRRIQRTTSLAAGRGWDEERLICQTASGTALESRRVTKAFQTHLAAAGLPRQRFHDARHACATLLLEAGEDLAVVSRVLGHSELSTTADTYAHLTRSMLGRAAERMDGVLPVRREAVV